MNNLAASCICESISFHNFIGFGNEAGGSLWLTLHSFSNSIFNTYDAAVEPSVHEKFQIFVFINVTKLVLLSVGSQISVSGHIYTVRLILDDLVWFKVRNIN